MAKIGLWFVKFLLWGVRTIAVTGAEETFIGGIVMVDEGWTKATTYPFADSSTNPNWTSPIESTADINEWTDSNTQPTLYMSERPSVPPLSSSSPPSSRSSPSDLPDSKSSFSNPSPGEEPNTISAGTTESRDWISTEGPYGSTESAGGSSKKTLTTKKSTNKYTDGSMISTHSTTDMSSARTMTRTPSPIPGSSSSRPLTSSRSSASTSSPSTTQAYCAEVCPKDYYEGTNACIVFLSGGGSYADYLGRCQNIEKGNMIGPEDIEPEFQAIRQMMNYYQIAEYKYFVNAYNSDLIRKHRSAQVMYISSTAFILTANDSIVDRSAQMTGVATICKIPKHCRSWTCPTSPALRDAPDVMFETVPPAYLSFDDSLTLKCRNESVSTRRWRSFCSSRGTIAPSPSIFNFLCKEKEKDLPARPVDLLHEEPIAELTCSWCFEMGTERCEKTPQGEPDKCHCKEGWKGLTCWRYPKYCPNTTCPEESITHAVCVCETERCVVKHRAFNRSTEMMYLDVAVAYAGPALEFIVRMAMQFFFPETGDTIQDSLQYMRSTFVTCSGVAYVYGGNPQTLKIDIAERRAVSLMFHFPQILVHLLYALEICHIDAVMSGRSDNKWKTGGKDKGRWDYAWTYAPTMILGLAFSMGIWYLNWDTQQREYTSLGVVDANFGMLGWAAIGYGFCAMFSFWKIVDIILNENRRHHEELRRDNKYETCHDPKLQENEDKCWRNLKACFFGAPIQCWYSISMLANLAYDHKWIKYANIILVILNVLAGVMQTLLCNRKFLGRIRAWSMVRKPLEEQYNEYTYLTTSETIALKGRAAYEEMLQKRKEAKDKEMEEKREKHQETIRLFEEKGIPMTFLPLFPLEGPPPCKVYEYDPCQKHYMCQQERFWKFGHWTNEFLGARVKVGISVTDAIEHVKNGLLDNGFLAGDECPSEQAIVMFKQWADMMLIQDRLDFARPNYHERRFLKNLDHNGFFDDMEGLSVANRVREAPIDPKKRRLMEPVVDMFSFSAPDQMTIGLGLCPDEFGFLWECKIIKNGPCITQDQETRVWYAILEDCETEHQRHDQIYTDTERYDKIGGEPYEAALKEFAKVKEAFPEGRDKKSLNPLFGSIDITMMNQNRPDFIGPRQPEYQIPAGPLLRRFFCERIYRQRRDLVFDILGEQAAQRRNNIIIRQNLRAHRKSKCTIL